MGRNQRVNFSLPPDVVEIIDEFDRGERSGKVAQAIRSEYGDTREE